MRIHYRMTDHIAANPPRKAYIAIGASIAATVVATVTALGGCGGSDAMAQSAEFTVSSPDLASGSFGNKHVLNAFGCTGGNVSPELRWQNAPAGTKGFALQVLDLDAQPLGFWHWSIYNIPATATGLAQGAGNAAASLPAPAFGGNNDFMDTGATGGNGNYGGPCPPTGDKPHRYQFTLYAYGVPDLSVAANAPRTGTSPLYGSILNKGIGNQLLGKASFIATFGR
jgi:Raf kinase inhibitor-like YbhB/YbcL family protein